ncbi:MAG: hypothetical protein H6810_10450 [Phycisphaeraceae bacterium]|nr:MAG: hypothetical protein H6810_10450 [Phycisphaeraceae bacterium]
MSVIAPGSPVQIDASKPTGEALTPTDLVELITSFNEVTAKLEATHATLRGEVARLNQELHEANERLRRSERLAELGEMAAGIAHEIRNPLGSISLYSEMLAKDLPDAGDGAPGGVARRIGSEVRRLDAIVRDVLSFARELRVRPEPIPIADLFDAATHSLRTTNPGRAAPVFGRLDAEPDRPRAVCCDQSLGLQALLNVIENARQAMGGTPLDPVTLDCRPVTLRAKGGRARPGVALIVTDCGPGIDEAVLERMFNPFFTTREAGTGLGLAIVHRIVDAHEGCVVVRNNSELDPGARGATVELHFPDIESDREHFAETERQG